MTLGERIVYYRKIAGLTQKGLAETMGISATRLNYWEKDKRKPDVAMINALCKALNIDGDTLLGRLEPEETKKAPGTDDSAPRADKEREIMRLVRTLSDPQKDFLIAYLETLVSQNQAGDPSAPESILGGALESGFLDQT